MCGSCHKASLFCYRLVCFSISKALILNWFQHLDLVTFLLFFSVIVCWKSPMNCFCSTKINPSSWYCDYSLLSTFPTLSWERERESYLILTYKLSLIQIFPLEQSHYFHWENIFCFLSIYKFKQDFLYTYHLKHNLVHSECLFDPVRWTGSDSREVPPYRHVCLSNT